MADLSSRKRVRDESADSVFVDSSEVKRIREDLLETLVDDAEFFTASHELDSFMKSFEEEIATATSAESDAVSVIDLTSESGDSQPELGYLFGATDDDLGLPAPPASCEEKAELIRVVADSSELGGELWGFDEGIIPNFDSYEFGIGDASAGSYNTSGVDEYVALDGLFDYSDMGFGSTDSLWRPETLPAKYY